MQQANPERFVNAEWGGTACRHRVRAGPGGQAATLECLCTVWGSWQGQKHSSGALQLGRGQAGSPARVTALQTDTTVLLGVCSAQLGL